MTEEIVREESHKLIRILKDYKYSVINIRVLGQWMFTGKLTQLEYELATLTNVTVTSGAGLTLSVFEVDRVTINLEAITSIGEPAFLPY
ncbi:MAG: hypothetical protein GX348_02240 [Veillonellaceae bacterium]|nr:hypothetical protein [Veillonellaceae bacterium]